MAIEGRDLFFAIMNDPDNIRQEHWDCVKELVGTVVMKHFPANNNPDFVAEFTAEFFLKLLPTLKPEHSSYAPASSKVHYGNYCYTLIRNTILNHVAKEFRYGLDLIAVSSEDHNETFHTEVYLDSYILRKYGDALLGTCYAVVAEEDIDAMLEFLNSKGLSHD